MKNVLLITDVHFWRGGAGHRAKIAALVSFLSNYMRLSVAFILPLVKEEDNKDEIEKRFAITITFLSSQSSTPLMTLGERLKEFASVNKPDCCIIEFIHLSFFLKYMDPGIIKILDTHDIAYDRVISYKQYNYDLLSMSPKTEIEVYNIFDYVMSICEPDYLRLKEFMPEEKIINVPHALPIHCTMVKEVVTNIGFVGNAFLPNMDGIWYFIRECWNDIVIKFPSLHLNIYGYIGDVLNNWEIFRYKNIHLKGFVPEADRIYNEMDIAINPVQFGAGIKIKCLEAMAYGKPLIVTPHSARGLEAGKNKAFLIAKNKMDFVNAIAKLVNDFPLRKQLSVNALRYIAENFNEKKCYEPLLNAINR